MKYLIFQELQNFHEDIYKENKLLDVYDMAFHKTKSNLKISSSVFVTEQDKKSYNESMNQSYKSPFSMASKNINLKNNQ